MCGSAVPVKLRRAALVVCEYCNTSLFLENEAVKQAGVKSVLADMPSIFEIGTRYRYRTWTFEMLGRVRFDYGDGIWDEWWAVLDSGGGRWISVDEGDIAIETPVELDEHLPDFSRTQVGQHVRFTPDSRHSRKDVRFSAENVCLCLNSRRNQAGRSWSEIDPEQENNRVVLTFTSPLCRGPNGGCRRQCRPRDRGTGNVVEIA